MTCTRPLVPPSHTAEAAAFAKEFGRQTSNFIDTLKLPSPLDPSVLAFRSKSGPYIVSELEDSNIVRPFVQDSLENAIRGLGITVDTTEIVDDLVNTINSFVGGAKATPTFSGFSTTSYRGVVFGGNAISTKELARGRCLWVAWS
ncbi:hypothetical protein Clacol_000910 [Clathrus columnatus]|uniref:Uncharacterized protein n=1 Tax=Clathrus columnatus TaxID=1419009 RepID=A0AAV5A1V2_9AGAM|nr:hypothetical protein Clacol_000910 [Clathrus columnatus]